MAREIQTEQVKKKGKKKKVIITLFILLILAGAGLGYYVYKHSGNKKVAATVKILDSVDNFGYSINDRDTDFYKEEFKELKDVLKAKEIDNEKYATMVARMFVNDLYTMSSKINKYDIGGSEFFYSSKIEMHNTKVMDTMYSTIKDDTYSDRVQELPEVKSMETESVEETTYKLDDKKVDAYLVKLSWTYVKDMGYDKEGSVVVVKDKDNRMSVVDFQHTLKPKYDTEKKDKK